MKKLGTKQNRVMRSLQATQNKSWFAGCGWMWDTHSGTTKVMESLWRAGLVYKTAMEGYQKYTLTELGKSYVVYKEFP